MRQKKTCTGFTLYLAVSRARHGPCNTPLSGADEGDAAAAVDVAMMLLAAGASVHLASPLQQTAAHLAAAAADATVLLALLRAGAVMQARDMNKWSVLFHAASSGAAECVKLLHARRADIHARDRWGYTPLCWCASGGHADAAGRHFKLLGQINVALSGCHVGVGIINHY